MLYRIIQITSHHAIKSGIPPSTANDKWPLCGYIPSNFGNTPGPRPNHGDAQTYSSPLDTTRNRDSSLPDISPSTKVGTNRCSIRMSNWRYLTRANAIKAGTISDAATFNRDDFDVRPVKTYINTITIIATNDCLLPDSTVNSNVPTNPITATTRIRHVRLMTPSAIAQLNKLRITTPFIVLFKPEPT